MQCVCQRQATYPWSLVPEIRDPDVSEAIGEHGLLAQCQKPSVGPGLTPAHVPWVLA